MAPRSIDDVKVTRSLGTPRGRYDECSSKFSLSKKPRFNRTSRRSKSVLKVVGEGV